MPGTAHGGWILEESEVEAFSHRDRQQPPSVIIHLPHASRVIPAVDRDALCLSDEQLAAELVTMTDAFTEEIFAMNSPRARAIVFPVSRLVVDPERFPDDAIEPMAARGMGVVYTRTAAGAPLRTHLDAHARQALLATYYEPHHHQLEAAVGAALTHWSSCLVIDGHSFPSAPLPYELDQSPDRPEICIGSDDFHSPVGLVDAAVRLCEQAGFRVAVNRPFSGALVPGHFYRTDRRVMAIMIEINRALYMDEASGERRPDFVTVAAAIQSVVRQLIDAVGTGFRRL